MTAMEIARGVEYPLFESPEAKGITRYLQPSAVELEALPSNVKRLRGELFDVVGMALNNRETRQVQTAESKQWDHLDIEATLLQRAIILQDAERKAVEMSRALDTTFPEYSPAYPTQFDIPDPETDFKVLMELDSFAALPDLARKEIQRAIVIRMARVFKFDDARRQAILDSIDAEG